MLEKCCLGQGEVQLAEGVLSGACFGQTWASSECHTLVLLLAGAWVGMDLQGMWFGVLQLAEVVLKSSCFGQTEAS